MPKDKETKEHDTQCKQVIYIVEKKYTIFFLIVELERTDKLQN